MNLRLVSFLVVSFVAFDLSGCTTVPTTDSPVANGKPPATETANGMPFPKLEKGMTAETIRQKLGDPAEIQPMPSPDGKAEVWIYKFEKNLGMTQVAAGTRDIEVMTMSSTKAGLTTMKEPIFTLAEKKSEITLSLLMFNGQLEVQKAKVEETISHN